MNRRTVLRHLAAGMIGLSGCASPPFPSQKQVTDAPPADLQRRVSVADVEPVPEAVDIQIKVSVRESTITDSHTAQLRVTLRNTGSARGISVATGGGALFNRDSQASIPRGIWLGRLGGREDDPYVTQTGPRWIASPPENDAYPDYGCRKRRYDLGEAVSVDYGIFHDDRTGGLLGGYLDPGTYWFEEDIFIAPRSFGPRNTDDPIKASCGFLIDIENPHCTICI